MSLSSSRGSKHALEGATALRVTPPRLGLEARGRARRGLLVVAIGAVSLLVAPSEEAAAPLVICAVSLGLLFAFSSSARLGSHVWAPMLGAAVMVLAAYTPLGESLPRWGAGTLGTEILAHLDVPLLILALAYLSISLDESGFFRWCAARMVRMARGDGRRLLWIVFVGISALTFVTSNDIVILSMTPILMHLGRVAQIKNLTPFLFALFIAANTTSMGLYVGNPTNIVIGGAVGLDFIGYAHRMFLPTVVATGVALGWTMLVFGRLSRRNRVPDRYRVPAPEADASWTREVTLKVVLFATCLAALGVLGNPWSLAHVLGDDVATTLSPTRLVLLTTLAFAVPWALLDALRDWRASPSEARGKALGRGARMPFEVIPFFVGFCVLLRGIESSGLTGLAADAIVEAFEHGPVVGSLATGAFGVIAVNTMNNIPASIFFEKLWVGEALGARLRDLHPSAADAFVDCSLFAANFGANLTFIGALAGLLWLRSIRSGQSAGTRVPGPRDFLVYGALVVPLVTVSTCLAIAFSHSDSPWLAW